MGKTLRKITSVAVTTMTVVSLSGASLLIPSVVLAQAPSIESLLAEITRLTALLNQLQVAQTGGAVATGACSFTRDLTVGAKGDDVKCLQTYLTGTGHFTFSGGATGFFGSVTRAAVAAWQAANAVAPSVGYFGSKSRAKYSAVAGVTPAAPGQPVVVPGAGMSVMAAANQPSGSAIAGAGQIDVFRFILTASASGGVNVSEMKFRKVGVVSDVNISNLYIADESMGGAIVAQYNSLTSNVATFSGLNMTVAAGQSKTLVLRVDLSSSATAGNTLGFNLESVSTGGPVSGVPVTGPTLSVTTVSNPSIATIEHSVTNGTRTVDAGTNGFLAHAASLIVVNSRVKLLSIKYTLVGSADKSVLKNWTFKINGVTVATKAVADVDVLLIVPTETVNLQTGTSVVELYVDVTGSPNRTFEAQLLRPFDLVAEDTTYNAKITATLTDADAGTNSDLVTINQGRITVAKASDTPTGNIPRGASSVVLSKFTIYGAGEPVKIRFIDLALVKAGGLGWSTEVANVNNNIRNIRIIDDVGGQLGSSISSVASGTGNGQCTLTSATQTDCHYGNSSTYINYIVPANTTRVLSAVVDVQSGASTQDITSLRADLVAMTSNLEGQISFQTASSGAVTGNTLTVVTSPLTVRLNTAVGPQSYVAGAQNVRIASFVLGASSAEGVKVNSMTFDKDDEATLDLQNLKIMVGGTQFGTTTAIIADAETSLSYSSSTPLVVPAGGSVTVDVFADILTSSTASTKTAAIDATSGSAVGSVSNSSVTWPAAVSGQNVVIVGAPTLTLAASSDNPAARNITMGATDVELFKLRMTVNDTEDVRVTDITFRDTITGGVADRLSLTDVKLYDSTGTLLAGPVSVVAGGASGVSSATITFALGSASPLLVKKNGSEVVTVKSGVGTRSGGAVSGQGHTLAINATADVTAYGKDSSSTATVTGVPAGNAQTIYRTKPSLSSSVLGAVSNRIRAAVDEIASLNWGVAASDDLTIATVTIRFAGAAASVAAGSGTAFNVRLIDAATNANWGSSIAGFPASSATQACTGAGTPVSCTVTFLPWYVISRGTTKTVKLRIDSTGLANTSQQQDGLSAIVDTAGSIRWVDVSTTTDDAAEAGTTSKNVSWEAVQIPITLLNIAYE